MVPRIRGVSQANPARTHTVSPSGVSARVTIEARKHTVGGRSNICILAPLPLHLSGRNAPQPPTRTAEAIYKTLPATYGPDTRATCRPGGAAEGSIDLSIFLAENNETAMELLTAGSDTQRRLHQVLVHTRDLCRNVFICSTAVPV